ncbi:cytochrome o ubiquinol oxidase subunit IV [Sphingopyxis sp. BSNA05]|uniref:cytochrome o ubiquinol oxidase subunit IV n=1 Tax=Sphingopyxis sp. BSNA05 TaxID=1236614 RepID=UPI0015632CB5|nr:cytochrome o ubiquinol oxidase subunit IV [Sphingopyxis sp. BSNA05]NRD89073.1 cytochrome o ubiquinol oxidase subunit IV [Sphingopyxis sp. BSNA05]
MDKRAPYHRDLRTYLIGFALAILLTSLSFWGALKAGLSPSNTLLLVGVLGLAQLIVHLRFFLHIDRSRQKREDLDLILFTTLVILIIVLGTVWILGNLASRMHMAM